MSWLNDYQSNVATIVETKVVKKLKNKYPNISFTRDEEGDTKVHFPTVYLHFMAGAEKNKPISSKSLALINVGVKIDVTCSKDQGLESCREVISTVIDEFENLYFSMSFSPEDMSTGNENKRMVATVQRSSVGQSDAEQIKKS